MKLQEIIELLENIKGNINPERGYAEELEAEIIAAITALELFGVYQK